MLFVCTVFCRLVVLVRLSVPVQVIDWIMTYNVLMGTLNPTHSLTHSSPFIPSVVHVCLDCTLYVDAANLSRNMDDDDRISDSFLIALT